MLLTSEHSPVANAAGGKEKNLFLSAGSCYNAHSGFLLPFREEYPDKKTAPLGGKFLCMYIGKAIFGGNVCTVLKVRFVTVKLISSVF